jgi:ribosome-binding protein aMBF1 (putative translation factor)
MIKSNLIALYESLGGGWEDAEQEASFHPREPNSDHGTPSQLLAQRSMPNENVKKRFGLAIKYWRQKSGISQEELAWRAQLHRTYVSGIETGDRNLSLQSIEKLALALHLSFSTLFQPLGDSPSADGQTTSVDGKRSASAHYW